MREKRSFEQSYLRLIGWVRIRLLAETNTARILKIARFYGEIRRANHDGIYHDCGVESKIEREILEDRNFSFSKAAGTGTVLIASELVDSGGHTAVVMHWMRSFHAAGDHRLLIARSVSPRVARSLEEGDLSYRVCARGGGALIEEIVKECARAERIVLHTHPDDIESAVAARVLGRAGKQVLFYNHADHVFSYGISSAGMVCEISSYGSAVNKETGRARRSCYLGIPINYRDRPRQANGLSCSTALRTIVSGGEAYKYAPGDVFFGDFIDSLLQQRNDVRVLLAGSTGKESWWRHRASVWGDKVVFLGYLPRDRYMEVLNKAEVYVDSFPITGGTAFPEALLSGKLVAGLRNPVQGYSPVDELRVGSVPDLARRVIDLLNGDPEAMSKNEEARRKAEEAHSMAQFHKRVEAIYRNEYEEAAKWGEMAADIHWLVRKWSKDRKIVLPSILRLLPLPMSFCAGFGFASLRARSFVGNPYLARIVLAIILRFLPPEARTWLLACFVRQKRAVFAR